MPVYSHTRLKTYQDCPRRFYYRYVARLWREEEPDQIATFLGSRVHDALEHLYVQLNRGITISVDELVGFFRDRWKSLWSPSIVIHEPGTTPAMYLAIGERCLKDYYRRQQPFDGARTIALERQICFRLDRQGKHQMLGFIDRLAKTEEGVWQIHDYKTNKYLPTQQDKDADPQLAYYEVGLRQMWPDAERVELVWHYLRFDTTIVSYRTPGQLEELRRSTVELIREIEAKSRDVKQFPPVESKLCDYCEYQDVCPVRKHLC
ncbi:MAG TPA: PD-(D/E)XK nuclease family protein [Pirellulales bacterium]|nr:PD-(D/E)XK nuclease family protein [Pirellulales bacterium]